MKNTNELRGFVTGLILGDGKIDKGVEKRSFSINSVNTDFIYRIRKYLNDNTNFKMTVVQTDGYVDKYGVNHRPYHKLITKAHPYFAKIYHQFYTDTRSRRITDKALSWLTPEGLANWYLSDGYIVLVGKTKGEIKDRRVEIATDRYSEKDVDRAIRYFENTFVYKMSKIKRGSNRFRIRFGLASAQYFLLMISPFVPWSMQYKLDMKYDYQPKWMIDEYYELMMSLNSADNPQIED